MSIFGGSDTRINATFTATDRATPVIKTLRSNVSAVGSKTGGPLGGLLSGIGSLNPASLVAGAGIGILTTGIVGSIEAFKESQAVQAQTEAALKSTGNAAGLTADQIGDLANSISAYSGTDDEAIQKGENLLLTFTGIKDAAGEGNDIFTQTTKIMVDMAQAMGTDAAGQAILLGKALNDPVRGLSALTRAGVMFTKEQRDQIAVMQKMGDIAGAQKVILAELNKEFGGSAKAFGDTAQGSIGKFNVALGNLEETIGEKLTPALEIAANALTVLIGTSEDAAKIEALNSRVLEINKQHVVENAKAWGTLPKPVGAANRSLGGLTREMHHVSGVAREMAPLTIEAFDLMAGGISGALKSARQDARHEVNQLWYDIRHPGEMEKNRNALAHQMQRAQKALHAAEKQGDANVIAEARALVAKLNAEWAQLNGTVTINARIDSYNQSRHPVLEGGRASGGSVQAGATYVVGEHRAELFVPKTDGTIIPYVPSGWSGGVPPHSHPIIVDGRELGRAVARGVDNSFVGWSLSGRSSTRK